MTEDEAVDCVSVFTVLEEAVEEDEIRGTEEGIETEGEIVGTTNCVAVVVAVPTGDVDAVFRGGFPALDDFGEASINFSIGRVNEG